MELVARPCATIGAMWVPSGEVDAGFPPQHVWNGRAVDIRIQNADFRPFSRQRKREVHGGRRFTHPPLPELTAMMFFTPLTPG